MTIEIVDFPIKNGGSFHSCVNQLTSLGVSQQKIQGTWLIPRLRWLSSRICLKRSSCRSTMVTMKKHHGITKSLRCFLGKQAMLSMVHANVSDDSCFQSVIYSANVLSLLQYIYTYMWYILISFLSHSTATILPSSPSPPPLSAVLPCLDQSSHLGFGYRLVGCGGLVSKLASEMDQYAMASSGTHTTVLRTNPCWLTDGDKDPCIVIFQNHSKNLQSLAMSHHVECARAYAMLTRSPYAALRKWGFCLRQTRYDKAVTKIVKGGFQTSSNAAWKHWTKT